MPLQTTTVHASAARTATGQTSGFTVGSGEWLAVAVDVTAVSGTTPSMTVNVEWSNDGTTWFVGDTADAFTAITAARKAVKRFEVKGLQFRLNYAITGTTPSFTFSAAVIASN